MFDEAARRPHMGPQDLDLLHSLSASHLMFGQYRKAADLLRLALWLDEDCARTIELSAYAAFQAGDYEATLSAIERCERAGGRLSRELLEFRRLTICRLRNGNGAHMA